MSGFNIKEEHDLAIDIKPVIINSSLTLIDEGDVFECETATEPYVSSPDHVDCHIYYPDTEETVNEDGNQEDPLGDTAEWTSHELITVDDELLNLECMTPSKVCGAFSIVNPLEIREEKPVVIETETFADGAVDTKPSIAQLKKHVEKRKTPSDSHVPVPSKRVHLTNNPDNLLVLKELKVNIGPKLQLPKWLLNKMTSKKVEKISEVIKCSSCDFTCQENSELKEHLKEHIVLKIFTCTRCNYKCTDALSHEAHNASCLDRSPICNLDQLKSKHILKNGYYYCEFCSYKFKNEQNLVLHEIKHLGLTRKLLECYVCQTGVCSANRLRDHLKVDHNAKEMIFSCNICQYSNIQFSHFKEHIMKHNIDKYLFCSSCKKNFEDLTEINEHLSLFHKNSRPRTSDIEMEVKTIKDELFVEDKMAILKSKFMSKNMLINNIYKCNGCSYEFSQLNNLLNHKKLHLNSLTPYKCCDCNFESFCLIDLKKHLLDHSQPTGTVICTVCKALKSVRQIKQHAVFHVGDGLYCFSCFKNFEDPQVYEQHLNSKHNATREELLTCSECSFKHINSQMLKFHKNRYHSKKEQQKTKNKSGKFIPSNKIKKHHIESELKNNTKPEPVLNKCVFKCNKCNFVFGEIDMLERHEKLNHGGDKDLFLCSVCNWTTSLRTCYLRHMSTHAGKNSFLCCYCQCEINKEQYFVKHILEHTYKCCPYCVFKCRNFVSLRSHFSRQHTPGNKKYSCSLCPYNSTKMSSLSTHCIMFHPKEFPSMRLPIPLRFLRSAKSCGLCPFISNHTNNLKKHICRHYINGSAKTKSNSDQTESIKLESTEEKNSIQNISNSFEMYQCSQCLHSSKHRKTIADHLNRIHNLQGGLRNNMILKISETQLQNNQSVEELSANSKENNANNELKLNDQIGFVNNKASSNSDATLKNQTKVHRKKHLMVKQRIKSAVKNNLQQRKLHACNICPYSSHSLHKLKIHKAQHFTGGPVKTKNLKPIADQIKPTSECPMTSQGSKLDNHIKKTSQINKDDNVDYSCSQCTFKSGDIKSVTLHLLDIHNIHGSLKNHMVIKVKDKLMQPEGHNKSFLDTGNERSLGKALQENRPSKPGKVKPLPSGVKIMKKPENDDKNEKCLQCNIHLLSKRAQVIHNSIGHTRYWDKPFSCTKPKCGMRFTTKQTLVRHELSRCPKSSILKNINTSKKPTIKKEDDSIKAVAEERSPVPDDESFACGECDYVSLDVTNFIKHMFIHTGIPDD